MLPGPHRGGYDDGWVPWDIFLKECGPFYRGPSLSEFFSWSPPFDSSMRMARRRFWRPGEDDPATNGDSAYDVALAALEELREQTALSARKGRKLPATSTISGRWLTYSMTARVLRWASESQTKCSRSTAL